MIYAYVVSALVIFGAGFATSHKLDQAEILKLENAIAQSNAQAEMTLKIAQEKVKNAAQERDKQNAQLEVANAQSLNTINSLHDDIIRLHSSNRENNRNAMSNSSNTGIVENQTESATFSARLPELLFEADQSANYAIMAWQFINNNCGIQ